MTKDYSRKNWTDFQYRDWMRNPPSKAVWNNVLEKDRTLSEFSGSPGGSRFNSQVLKYLRQSEFKKVNTDASFPEMEHTWEGPPNFPNRKTDQPWNLQIPYDPTIGVEPTTTVFDLNSDSEYCPGWPQAIEVTGTQPIYEIELIFPDPGEFLSNISGLGTNAVTADLTTPPGKTGSVNIRGYMRSFEGVNGDSNTLIYAGDAEECIYADIVPGYCDGFSVTIEVNALQNISLIQLNPAILGATLTNITGYGTQVVQADLFTPAGTAPGPIYMDVVQVSGTYNVEMEDEDCCNYPPGSEYLWPPEWQFGYWYKDSTSLGGARFGNASVLLFKATHGSGFPPDFTGNAYVRYHSGLTNPYRVARIWLPFDCKQPLDEIREASLWVYARGIPQTSGGVYTPANSFGELWLSGFDVTPPETVPSPYSSQFDWYLTVPTYRVSDDVVQFVDPGGPPASLPPDQGYAWYSFKFNAAGLAVLNSIRLPGTGFLKLWLLESVHDVGNTAPPDGAPSGGIQPGFQVRYPGCGPLESFGCTGLGPYDPYIEISC